MRYPAAARFARCRFRPSGIAKTDTVHPERMVGEWNMMSAEDPKRFGDCNSDHSDWFGPGGYFERVGDRTGRGAVEGDKLTMVTTDPGQGDPEAKGASCTIRFNGSLRTSCASPMDRGSGRWCAAPTSKAPRHLIGPAVSAGRGAPGRDWPENSHRDETKRPHEDSRNHRLL